LPVLFLDAVLNNPDLFESWFFSEATLLKTHGIILSVNIIMFTLGIALKIASINPGLSLNVRYNIIYKVSYLIIFIFFIGSVFSLYQLIDIILTNGYLKFHFTLASQKEKLVGIFHFNTLRYLVLGAFFYLYAKTKKRKFFLVLLPYIFFEMLAGGRTTSFIFILFIYLLLVKETGKIYLNRIFVILLLLLVSVLFSRSASLGRTNFDLLIISSMAFGEFINTFLTLPFIIENEYYLFRPFEEILFSLYSGVLPGFIIKGTYDALSSEEVGATIAAEIGKGFGLGSNAISELIINYGFSGIIFFPCLYLLISYIDNKTLRDSSFLIRFFLIIHLRLYMRQGFASLISVVYIFIMYLSIFYFSHHNYKRMQKRSMIKL
jgi:oligosaccharide repeat unit polymerase